MNVYIYLNVKGKTNKILWEGIKEQFYYQEKALSKKRNEKTFMDWISLIKKLFIKRFH